MGLSIKTEEADRLARETRAADRRDPDRGHHQGDARTAGTPAGRVRRRRANYVERMKAFVNEHAHLYDRRPVTKQEWDVSLRRHTRTAGPSQVVVVDSSAIAAILFKESESIRLHVGTSRYDLRLISAVNYVDLAPFWLGGRDRKTGFNALVQSRRLPERLLHHHRPG